MNTLTEIYNRIVESVTVTLPKLIDTWPVKAAISFGTVVAAEVLHTHLVLFLAFALLEGMDCFTKWIARAHKMLVDKDPGSEPSLWECIKNITTAHETEDAASSCHENYVSSAKMRKQWGDKMITYLILIIMAGTGDAIIKMTHGMVFLLNIVVSYVSATEFISVLENLNDAGVSMASALMGMVKSKLPKGGDHHDDPK